MLGWAARLRVGDEAGDRPAGAGQDADQSADDLAAQEVDLAAPGRREGLRQAKAARGGGDLQVAVRRRHHVDEDGHAIETDERGDHRSEEKTSELQTLLRNSYAVFC